MAGPEFWTWSDEKRNPIIRELKRIKQIIEPFHDLQQRYEDMDILLEMAANEKSEETLQEIDRDLAQYNDELQSFTIQTTFTHPDDSCNAFISIQAGSGGTDACDWAYMLFRMYSKYSASKKFSVEILDYQIDKEGGLKSSTMHVKGPWVYGYLQGERGVHRLVRISPYDAGGHRHTSFAAVDVVPEQEEDATLDIAEKDLRIDFYRSSGAGGQHVNVTDSAVRIYHIPTGIVVCCQNERSQHKNRAYAMKVLRSRLLQRKKQERDEAMAEYYGSKGQVTWSHQIRSYVLHPYSLVKDHRTEYETGNALAVLDGELDNFIHAYIMMCSQKRTVNYPLTKDQ